MEQQEQQNTSEPHVQIFGQEVSEEKMGKKHFHFHDKHCECHRHNHHDGGSVIWGLIIILGGAILLLNYMGFVPWTFWNFIWPLWPVLLILMGVRVALGRNWVSSIITFLVGIAVLGFVAIYGLVQIHSPLANFLPPDFVNFINIFNQLKQ